MLTVKDLNTHHGFNHALKGVSFEVPEGKIVAIVGANGAGKSTLLGTIAGIYKGSNGDVVLGEESTYGLPVEKVVKKGISLVPERRQIFDSLTIEENLLLGAYHRLRPGNKEDINNEIERMFELFPPLLSRRHDLAGKLSGGMQQMLAIGRGLMAKPKVLMLDEPSLGLAPLIVKEIFDILNTLKTQEKTTILVVEQNARAAMKVADWIYVIDQGKVVLDGDPEVLKQDERVQRAFLGKGI